MYYYFLIGRTWQFPCQKQKWVWQPEGYTGSSGCRSSQLRLHSWQISLWWSLQQASSHTEQLKYKTKDIIYVSPKLQINNCTCRPYTTVFTEYYSLLQSCFIPRAMQRCSRQYWQRFRWSLLMAHSPEPLHVYTRFFLMLRLKKPLQPSQLTAP